MPRRNETTHQPRQEQRGTTQNRSTQQTARIDSSQRDPDRERGLRTEREPQSRSGPVQSGQRPGATGIGATQTPFGLMRRMMEDMDHLFEEFGSSRGAIRPGLGGSPFLPVYGGSQGGLLPDLSDVLWAPAVEIQQKGDKLVIRADIPGVSRDDVEIEVTDDTLIIQGERRYEHEDSEEGFYRSEVSYGRFFRSIPLPEGIDSEKADAKFKDGILEVTLPAPKREKRSRKLSLR